MLVVVAMMGEGRKEERDLRLAGEVLGSMKRPVCRPWPRRRHDGRGSWQEQQEYGI